MMYLGFDIGKRAHDAALLDGQGEIVWQLRFAPTRAGLAQLAVRLADLPPADVQIGLEATGIYWLTLHAWLREWGAAQGGVADVRVLNPLQTRAFRNANLRGTKTDRIDAVAVARLLHWGGKRLASHAMPEDRQAAAREISRLRTEMVELRARQLTKLHTVLDPLFPEFAAVFSDLGSPSALAVLARWPTPAALAHARASEVTRVLHTASRGHLGAETARELRACAATSVGVVDPYGAAATAVQTLVAHLEQLRAARGRVRRAPRRPAGRGRGHDGPAREHPGLRPRDHPDVDRRVAADGALRGQAREQTRVLKKPKHGAEKLVAAVGLDAQVKQSGRSAGRAHMSKRGNRYVRRAVMLAARSAARTDAQCQAIYDAQRAKGKPYLVALSHVAHQLLHIAYSVLLHAKPYELPARYAAVHEPELAMVGA